MANTYTLINSTSLSTTTASVTFSAIPATYDDLVLQVSVRSDYSGGIDDGVNIVFNSDSPSSTNYSFTYLIVNPSTPASGRFSNRAFTWALYTSSNSTTANTFGSGEIYLPKYTSTSAKPHSAFSVGETNSSSAIIGALAGLYRASSAISSITMKSLNGTNWLTGSTFWLYGIKNS